MRKLLTVFAFLFCIPTWATVQLSGLSDNEPFSLKEVAAPVVQSMNAAPSRDPQYDVGLVLTVDQMKYYVKPYMFMAKSRSDEVCKPVAKAFAYRCEEGQPFVYGCHLLFFNARGEWVGFKTLAINERTYPHFCNAMPAMGVANREKNELLITLQYFLADGDGAKRVSDVGDDWFRMTSLIRIKANQGKIEVEQDDSCLGNPNQLDTIAKARKQLQRCEASKK